jgi:putative flippase GtrA
MGSIIKLRALLPKYSKQFSYLGWGIMSNLFGFGLLFVLSLFVNVIVANAIATIVSVAIAYFTNALFVFHNSISLPEFIKFVIMRSLSIAYDIFGMWLLIALGIHAVVAKGFLMATNTIANYFVSKHLVFKRG